MPAPESLTEEEIEGIIELNMEIVRKRGQEFEVDADKIRRFLSRLSVHNDIKDRRKRIIRKASHILAGLAWHQYFNDANKETATRVVIYYLRRNGFDLSLKSKRERRELYDMLTKTIEKFPQDKTIYAEIEQYLGRKVVSLI